MSYSYLYFNSFQLLVSHTSTVPGSQPGPPARRIGKGLIGKKESTQKETKFAETFAPPKSSVVPSAGRPGGIEAAAAAAGAAARAASAQPPPPASFVLRWGKQGILAAYARLRSAHRRRVGRVRGGAAGFGEGKVILQSSSSSTFPTRQSVLLSTRTAPFIVNLLN